MRRLVILVSVLSFSVLGCQALNDMKKMKKTTEEMKATTDKMNATLEKTNETTAGMSLDTNELTNMTSFLYKDMRRTLSVQLQDPSFEKIISAEHTQEKMGKALEYFGALDLQFWKNTPNDNESDWEKLKYFAARSTIQRFLWLIDDKHPVDLDLVDLDKVSDFRLASGLNLGEPNNKWMSLATISVAMSYVSKDQELLAQEKGFEPASVYSIIRDGLRYKDVANRGEKIPLWAYPVLANEQDLIYMLQLRHNYFLWVIMGLMTDIEDQSFWQKLGNLKLNINLSVLNKVQLDEQIERANKIKATLDLLKELKIQPQYHWITKKMVESIKIYRDQGQKVTSQVLGSQEAFVKAMHNAVGTPLN